MHHRVALVVERIHVRLARQQHVHQRHVALDHSQVQRREAVLVGRLDQLWCGQGHTGRRHQVLLGAAVVQRILVVIVAAQDYFWLQKTITGKL